MCVDRRATKQRNIHNLSLIVFTVNHQIELIIQPVYMTQKKAAVCYILYLSNLVLLVSIHPMELKKGHTEFESAMR